MNIFSSWVFWAVMAAIMASITAITSKLTVSEINPDLATFLRIIVIFILIGAILYFSERLNFKTVRELNAKSIIFIVLSGVSTGLSWLCYFRALKIGHVAQVAPIDKLSVLFTALLGTFLLGESLNLKEWIGIIFISLGALLMIFK